MVSASFFGCSKAQYATPESSKDAVVSAAISAMRLDPGARTILAITTPPRDADGNGVIDADDFSLLMDKAHLLYGQRITPLLHKAGIKGKEEGKFHLELQYSKEELRRGLQQLTIDEVEELGRLFQEYNELMSQAFAARRSAGQN